MGNLFLVISEKSANFETLPAFKLAGGTSEVIAFVVQWYKPRFEEQSVILSPCVGWKTQIWCRDGKSFSED